MAIRSHAAPVELRSGVRFDRRSAGTETGEMGAITEKRKERIKRLISVWCALRLGGEGAAQISQWWKGAEIGAQVALHWYRRRCLGVEL